MIESFIMSATYSLPSKNADNVKVFETETESLWEICHIDKAFTATSFVEWFIVRDCISRCAFLDTARMPPQLPQCFPKFTAFLNSVFTSVNNLVKHITQMEVSWKNERASLLAARDAFEASTNLLENEVQMIRAWSFQLQSDLQEVCNIIWLRPCPFI